jgi:nickel superoxide dismutase
LDTLRSALRIYDQHKQSSSTICFKSYYGEVRENTLSDVDFRIPCYRHQEERSLEVKHTFGCCGPTISKAPHFEYQNLTLYLTSSKLALAPGAGTKGTTDVAVADKLLKIDEISEIFWATKKA